MERFYVFIVGYSTGLLHLSLQSRIQPLLESFFIKLLGAQDGPLGHIEFITSRLSLQWASHTVTGIFLSPLELLKTRL